MPTTRSGTWTQKLRSGFNTVPWVIIVILLVITIIQKECSSPNGGKVEYLPGETVVKTIVIPGDTVEVPYPVVEVIKEDSIVYVEVPRVIDSSEIAKDYYARRYYDVDLIDDSLLYIRAEAMVSENKLEWIIPHRKILRPQIIHHYTTVVEKVEPRTKGFIGLGIGRSPNSFGVAPSLEKKKKKDNLYTLSYDVLNGDTYFTVYFKLRLRK